MDKVHEKNRLRALLDAWFGHSSYLAHCSALAAVTAAGVMGMQEMRDLQIARLSARLLMSLDPRAGDPVPQWLYTAAKQVAVLSVVLTVLFTVTSAITESRRRF